MKLADLNINESCRILDFEIVDEKLKLRLEELGLYRGNIIKILKKSPLKKTLLIQIFNSCFAIKTAIASEILIEKI